VSASIGEAFCHAFELSYDAAMSTQLFDLAGRVAIVVGGTSGIGRTLAGGLADAGADVVATGRRAALVEEVAREIEQRGRRTLRIATDVVERSEVERLRDACLDAFGRIDILVCAAGITRRVPTLEMADADWDAILATNLTGTLHACRAIGGAMLERGTGRIINIASLAAHLGFFEVAAYTASKSAVAGLTRALAVEWAPRGVTVNALVPGVFKTDLNRFAFDTPRGEELLQRTPMRRFGRPEELIGATVFLASDAASFVTGQLIAVDGGFLASGVNQ
jgi:NAD(P)-dependent dehydrogenase (short-subunit alcohol dehydrogenase family)